MKNIRLLLVDDEDNFRQTLAKRLTKKGIAPEQAESGEKALSILEKKEMDVVVLDVKMPVWTESRSFAISKKSIPGRKLSF